MYTTNRQAKTLDVTNASLNPIQVEPARTYELRAWMDHCDGGGVRRCRIATGINAVTLRSAATGDYVVEKPTCPACCSGVVVSGPVRTGEYAGHGFVPRGLKGWNTAYVPINPEFFACADCGMVWTNVVAGALPGFLERNLGPLGMECYRALRDGPGWDLPGHETAQAAARAVAEINDLMLRDRQPEATRKYRDLSGRTWDEASHAIFRWKKLTRAEKLALFGWEVKDKEGRIAGAHPLHDRLLDG